MHRLNELAAKLTPAQLKEVEDFAKFLVSRKADDAQNNSNLAQNSSSFGSWVGSLANVHPEMSDKEFKTLIRNEWVRTAED